ncbi:HORMA domain-containing protein 1 [Strongylocentrotus purpuratus]|uniref:HORMA domain-containing protein n=1 Tax=Strongylocentrotus purpuratus TaxID=7668 RepID=A0A7M7T0L9_STRPU|nr:HORMA domain-containing protein 1 [Strongylocentrotus purpuratus]
MATATSMRPKTKTGQWSAIFPPDQVTQQQSAVFVKKLLAVAVSTVTYLRTIFPEHAFGDRSLEDLNLKILKDDSACPGACQVIKWMKGAFDALDKRYLRAMIIGMYTDPSDPNTAMETYTFKFTYSKNGPDVDIYRNEEKITGAHTEAQTKRATLQLLRTILVLTQSLKLLPDDVMMTMKLLYYDDVTPMDYEPPGFQASDSDAFNYDDEPINLRVGEVTTPFHTVKLRITTDKRQFDMKPTGEEEGVEEEEEAEKEMDSQEMKDQQEPDMEDTEREKICVDEEKSGMKDGPKTAEDVPDSSPNVPGAIDEASQSSKTGEEEEEVHEEAVPQCPCGCNEDDGLMIQCEKCQYWQHAVCFMILHEDEVPEKHYCHQCGKVGDPQCEPTDPYLNQIDSAQVRATCLWRRTLEAAKDMDRVTAPTLAKRLGVETGVAQTLLKRLEKEGYCSVDAKNKRLVKFVNQERIVKHGFQKYLSRLSPRVELEEMEAEEKHKRVAMENKKNKTSLQRKKYVKKSELEKLTDQAADLSVSGLRTRSGRSSGPGTPMQVEELPKQKRSKKRSATTLDGRHDFDLACSQEPDGGQERKRRKSSVVNNPVLA